MRGEQGTQSDLASTSGRRITCPLPSWVSTFAEALEKITRTNTPLRARCGDGSSIYLSAWHTLTDPKIPMQSYVERLWRYSGCTAAAAFASLVYIERLAALEDSFTPTAFNIHRLLTVTLVLGMKFYQEEVYPQDYLAMVGGMSGVELNLLELEVLTHLGFNAFVHEAQLQRAIDVVRAHVAGGRARAFPSAAQLLDSLWEDETEEVVEDPPSTPPSQAVAAPQGQAAAQGPSGLAKSAARRWSDSFLMMAGEDADAMDEGAFGSFGGKRIKVSVSEGCFGVHEQGKEAEQSMDGESLGFRSLDEELLGGARAGQGFTAREALGALLCDEVFEDYEGSVLMASQGPAAAPTRA